MRYLCVMLPLALAIPAVVPAQTLPTAAASTSPGKYSVEETPLGTLLDDPAAKAVLVKYIPTIVANDQVDQARNFTLKTVQTYAADQVTDEKLAAIDAALAKLPAKK